MILVLRVLKDRRLTSLTLWRHCNSEPWSLSSYLCACMVVSALLTLLNTLKCVIGTIGVTYDHAHWFFYLLLQHGVTALFSFPTLLLSLVCICLFVCPSARVCVCVSVCHSACLSVYLCVCLSMCLCVCMSVCASVCLYVIMYYEYMYVVFIVIKVCKLLHVRRPTSSPRAVWNPCKINKAYPIHINFMAID